jgi:hypothetical protein
VYATFVPSGEILGDPADFKRMRSSMVGTCLAGAAWENGSSRKVAVAALTEAVGTNERAMSVPIAAKINLNLHLM